MFRKIFAVALVLILVGLCTRRPMDIPASGTLPNTCAAAQFAAAVEEFEGYERERDRTLARIEALPVDEPRQYAAQWQKEIAVLRELAARADAASLPRCLAHAKELFVQYLGQTVAAAELRAPDRDPVDYRRARETAESIHGQYLAEVKLQEQNRQR